MTERGTKQKFRFRLRYFKPSGKWYTDTLYEYECASIETTGPHQTPYMNDAVAHIRGLRDNGGQGAMPGLQSRTWDGHIIVEHFPVGAEDDEDLVGFPTLITAKEA